jgi:hypothetical protein
MDTLRPVLVREDGRRLVVVPITVSLGDQGTVERPKMKEGAASVP